MPRSKPNKIKELRSSKLLMASRVKNPCQTAWEIFSTTKQRMGEKFKRKFALIAACEAGVAFHTARTQYQEWKQAGDRDAQRNIQNVPK